MPLLSGYDDNAGLPCFKVSPLMISNPKSHLESLARRPQTAIVLCDVWLILVFLQVARHLNKRVSQCGVAVVVDDIVMMTMMLMMMMLAMMMLTSMMVKMFSGSSIFVRHMTCRALKGHRPIISRRPNLSEACLSRVTLHASHVTHHTSHVTSQTRSFG